MEYVVDARNKDCPQPVIMAKKALEEHARIVVYVDNGAALENVRRLGAALGCEVTIVAQDDGTSHLHLTRGDVLGAQSGGSEAGEVACNTGPGPGYVVALTSEGMGQGSDELGVLLMKAFIHTLLQVERLPDAIVCYNAGVKLACLGADTLEDLQQLERSGVKLLLCGTCINYYALGGRTGAGAITNMFEILSILSASDRIVRP